MNNKILLIIDPQVDFVAGSLEVPGATVAMDRLAEYIHARGGEYRHIVVTADRHPMNHCSFRTNGGMWPVHCVADSVGAAVWPSVMGALLRHVDRVRVLHKGENPDKEEYSIMKNHREAEKLSAILNSDSTAVIDVCGLAGDVCVADTLRGLVNVVGASRLNVLREFSPSLDGGGALDLLIQKYDLTCDR